MCMGVRPFGVLAWEPLLTKGLSLSRYILFFPEELSESVEH